MELNYREATEILTERFGNKQTHISSHMETLLKLQQGNAMPNVKGIWAVLDNLEFRLEVYKLWELILLSMELFWYLYSWRNCRKNCDW